MYLSLTPGFTLDVSRRKDSIENIIHFELLNVELATRRTIESVAENAVKRAEGTAIDTKKATIMGSCKYTLFPENIKFEINFYKNYICSPRSLTGRTTDLKKVYQL